MITNEDMKVLLKSQQGEMDALLMYRELAKVVKDEKDKEVFCSLPVRKVVMPRCLRNTLTGCLSLRALKQYSFHLCIGL